jgi:hypothetical protein
VIKPTDEAEALKHEQKHRNTQKVTVAVSSAYPIGLRKI